MGDVLKRYGKLYVRWYDGAGHRRQQATACTSEREARAVLRELETDARKVRDGRLPQTLGPSAEVKARAALTVRALASMFLGDVVGVAGYAPPRIKCIKSYRRDARSAFKARIFPVLGDRAAATVTSADVEALRDGLLARGLANASALQTMAILSKLFAWARKAGLIDGANPVQGVERPRPAQSVDYLDKGEVGQLLATGEAHAVAVGATHEARMLWPMVAVAIFAGLRKGELFGLRWVDCALDVGRLDVNRSYRGLPKSGKARHVPAHPEIVRALRWWRSRCPAFDGLVFPVEAEPGRLRMGSRFDAIGVAGLLTGAGCHLPADGKPWHMLRHTFASQAVMSGASLYAVQQALGHSTAAMTQRYAHLAPSHMAGEFARMTFSAPSVASVSDLGEARRLAVVEGG